MNETFDGGGGDDEDGLVGTMLNFLNVENSLSSDFPSFFSNSGIDDTKYDSLLADLRAHDLLGPEDYSGGGSDRAVVAAGDALGEKKTFGADLEQQQQQENSKSLKRFLTSELTGNTLLLTKKPTTKPPPPPGFQKNPPPPGFSSSAPGPTPTKQDLEWARSQHELNEMKKGLEDEDSLKFLRDFRGLNTGFGLNLASLKYDDDDEDDEEEEVNGNYIVSSSLQSLGLYDDEDEATSIHQNSQPVSNKDISSTEGKQPVAPPKLPPPLPPPVPSVPPPLPVVHLNSKNSIHPPLPPPIPPSPPQMMFRMMTPRDINFIIQQQLKQIRSSDPFSDDYYFYNYIQKKRRESSMSSSVPLPSWKLGHTLSYDPRDEKRACKSRSWESQNQVLGRNDKSSLYRPRELLNLSVLCRNQQPRLFIDENWLKRHSIEKGYQCLLSLQDARHLLDARQINVQQFHQLDEKQLDPSLVALRQKTAQLLLELASILGVCLQQHEEIRMKCQKQVLLKLLAVNKGKRLIIRALPLLHPSARFVILPVLIEYLLSVGGVSAIDPAQQLNDEKLSQTLVITLLYHPPFPPAAVWAKSLQLALHDHNLQSMNHLLQNRPRAELLQALLQKGGALCTAKEEDAEIQQTWTKYQTLFIELATQIKLKSSA